MTYWHQIIRSGDHNEDQRLLAAAQAHATGQGLVLRVQPLPYGGLQVEAVSPSAPPSGGYAPSSAMVAWTQPRAMVFGCQTCGRHAPTKQVEFRSNIGLVILRIPRSISGQLCRRCISKHFWEHTLTTTFLGWWGVISFFYSLVTIPMNIATFLGARDVADEFSTGSVPAR